MCMRARAHARVCVCVCVCVNTNTPLSFRTPFRVSLELILHVCRVCVCIYISADVCVSWHRPITFIFQRLLATLFSKTCTHFQKKRQIHIYTCIYIQDANLHQHRYSTLLFQQSFPSHFSEKRPIFRAKSPILHEPLNFACALKTYIFKEEGQFFWETHRFMCTLSASCISAEKQHFLFNIAKFTTLSKKQIYIYIYI